MTTTTTTTTTTRAHYVAVAGSLQAAVEFEHACLSIGRDLLPSCAIPVLDGGEPTPAYWQWLIDERLDGATIAAIVSEKLDDDGQRYETDDGRTLDDLCRDLGASISYDRKGFDNQLTRYQFVDGSSIVCASVAWDFGYDPDSGCDGFCWQGSGDHRTGCPLDDDE